MILVLERGVNAVDRERLERLADAAGLVHRFFDAGALGSPGAAGEAVLVIGRGSQNPDPDLAARMKLWPGVAHVLDQTERHPLCRAAAPTVSIVSGADPRGCAALAAGPNELVWIAGPCAVENAEVLGEVATAVARAGASMLRGGAFKPRTSPYSFQGMGRDGLLLLAAVGRDVGLPVVTEVLDPRDVDFVAQHADMLQIGARSMQNFPLLVEAGRTGKPVLLKRGMAATLDELLAAAEYVLAAGGDRLVLCERGVRGFDPSRRNILDLSIVPALRERTRLPVFVDPSHGTGRRSLVVPMAKAAVAAGADGIMVEVHSRPEDALSDGAQALQRADLEPLGRALRSLAELEERRMPAGPYVLPDSTESAPVARPPRAAEAGEGQLL